MANRFTKIHIPSECREMIRSGALVAISHSGGKDSQAMTILLSRIIPRDQLVAVHAPLGEVEWPQTIEHIQATLPDGVPLILAPVTSGKTLLDRVEERGMWPGIHQRWCTASHYGQSSIANRVLWVVRSTAYKIDELSRARPRLMLYGIPIRPGASCRARELRIALRSGDAAMLPAGSGQ